MRKAIALVLAVTAMLAASIAGAAPAARPEPAELPAMALAVNAPTRWKDDSFAGSLYIAIAGQHGVRLNAASYPYTANKQAVLAALSSNGIESDYSGQVHDLGIGWQYFSRKVWDGASIEADILVRTRQSHVDDTIWQDRITDADTTTYAARVMVGWSWLVADRAFFAVSVGASSGVERGTEVVSRMDDAAGTSRGVNRNVTAAEGFMRFGVVFGR